MKNVTLFAALFLFAAIISCTMQNRASTKAAEPKRLTVFLPAITTKVNSKVITEAPFKTAKDTVYKYSIKEVQVLDTAALNLWWRNLETKIAYTHKGEVDDNFLIILAEYRKALQQNSQLINRFKTVKAQKDKAVEKNEINTKVIYEIPLIMYIVLATSLGLILVRQEYLKRKLNSQIKEIRQCRYK